MNITRARPITHEHLRQAIRDCATLLGWRCFTTQNSRGTTPGEPDIRLIHPGQRRVLWVELKTGSGRLTRAQRDVLADLRAAGQEAVIWHERDWRSGEVERVLRGGEARRE